MLIANTSQTSGERKFTHSGPRWLGKYGKMKNASQGRPMWMSGNSPAHMTAKIVIASAERLIDVRHFCRNSSRIAEISVPAWPMPIQNTKLVMSNAQPTRVVEAPDADALREQVGHHPEQVQQRRDGDREADPPAAARPRLHRARDVGR